MAYCRVWQPGHDGAAEVGDQHGQGQVASTRADALGLGVGIYSSHPNDNNGFTCWQGNAALIPQDDALRAAVA